MATRRLQAKVLLCKEDKINLQCLEFSGKIYSHTQRAPANLSLLKSRLDLTAPTLLNTTRYQMITKQTVIPCRMRHLLKVSSK